MALWTSQYWLASTIRKLSGPISSRYQRTAADIVLDIPAHLEFEVAPSLGQRLPAEATDLRIAVAQPAGGGGVGRVARGQHFGFSVLLLACNLALQQRDGLRRREDVGDVAEVDAAHQFCGRHVHHQFPEGLAGHLGPDIPDGVSHDAPVARWSTPFSGPTQRNWPSLVRVRQ